MFLDSRLGNTPRWFLSRPKDWKMRVPDTVRDCVVFVGRVINYGTEERRMPAGTAFIVTVPSEEYPDTVYMYIVTARHVARQLSLGGPWFVRFNLKAGEFAEATVDEGGWWYHPTESETVDAAVRELPFSEAMEFSAVPVSAFATEEIIKRHDIGPGDAVFFTGLFTKMMGRRRNIPIVRMGNLSMLPTERVPIRIDKGVAKEIVESEVYLVEARSLGGLSGSPVFVRETIYMPVIQITPVAGESRRDVSMQSHGAFFLLGVMHGHWDIRKEDFNEIEMPPPREDEEALNLGVAIVVPAKKIREILYRPELVEKRRLRGRKEESGRKALCLIDVSLRLLLFP